MTMEYDMAAPSATMITSDSDNVYTHISSHVCFSYYNCILISLITTG